MRKIVCFIFALCFIPFLTACDVTKNSTLTEISRPYSGEYVCKTLTVGGEDLLKNFEFIKLDLGYDGNFELFYQTSAGGKGSYGGEYRMEEEKESITFTAKNSLRTVTRSFPYKNGSIFVDLNFGGRMYHAEFSFPE